MNDDINVSGASAAIFTAIRSGNTLLSKLADRVDSDVAKAEVRAVLVNVRAMLDTLGLDPLAEPWVSEGAAGGAAGAVTPWAQPESLSKTPPRAPPGPSNNPPSLLKKRWPVYPRPANFISET